MKRTRPAILLAACGLGAASLVIAAAQQEPPRTSSAEANETPNNGALSAVPLQSAEGGAVDEESRDWVVFSSTDESLEGAEVPRPPSAEEMRRKLQDPEQRKLMRASTRENIREENPEVAQVLLLDSSVEAALIELLTDKRMEETEYLWTKGPFAASRDQQQASMFDTKARADEETRHLAKLKELLGEEGFEQYQDYRSTVGSRREAIWFDKHLDPGNKLTPEQKERLIPLLHDQRQKEYRHQVPLLSERLTFSDDPRERKEQMRRDMIRGNEAIVRNMEMASRELLERLPQVLTPQQVEVFAELEAKKIAGQRKHVEKMRVQAGLSPELEAAPPAQSTPRKAMTGPIRFDVYFEVNHSEPVELSLRTENGKAVSFQAPEGLWVEATPTLYQDGWLQVEFKYFEGSPGRRREIGHGSTGTRTWLDRPEIRYGGAGGTMLTGSKGYAITERINATPIAQK